MLLELIGNASKVEALQHELHLLEKQRRALPTLTQDDYDNCSDAYQERLEIGYELDALREEIRNVKRNQGD